MKLVELIPAELFGKNGKAYIVWHLLLRIPDTVIEATIISGARAFKLGKRAEAAIRVTNIPALQYTGPTDPEELFKQKFYLRNQVNVSKSKVTRTRPMFTDWELEFTVDFQEDMISADDLDKCIKRAGEIAGMGDWRPKYGLFELLSATNSDREGSAEKDALR